MNINNLEEQYNRPLVVVRCCTYNQESYIEDALKGIILQKTNFLFYAVVHDDASIDGTADIIRQYAEKYPNIIRPIYEEENQYSKHDGSLKRLMDKACKNAKYVAICEGDDYWVDPLKLQKQVDFLESNPECGMCHTNARIKIGERIIDTPIKSFNKDRTEQLLLGNNVFTATALIRQDVYMNISELYDNITKGRRFSFTDYPLWLLTSLDHSIGYINDYTAVYRVLSESASHFVDKRKQYEFDSQVLDFRQLMLKYCKTKRTFSNDFLLQFYENIFHLRKRLLYDFGLCIAYSQIWKLIRLFPYWPIIFSRSIKRHF